MLQRKKNTSPPNEWRNNLIEMLNFNRLACCMSWKGLVKDPFKIVTNILSLNFDDLKDPFKLDANMLRKCSIGTV